MFDRQDQKRQVQDATDVVDLVGEHVALKPRGREFLGLCPFHEDRNPSLYVVPHKQIYHCFACGAGGDVFTFVMQYHRMAFPQALEYLAQRAGIELRHAAEAGEKPDQRQRLVQANTQALEYFRANLFDIQRGREARDYLRRRGMADAMVQAFQLGYALDDFEHLTRHIQARGWEAQAFRDAGLIAPRQQGRGDYDRLRHRLIFPIGDALGRPIAFGGRRLREEDNPKYLNSPETVLFNKSATLYGLHLAKQAIIQQKTAVVVEGYTDVIACHQAGMSNVVAALGTAFTAEHVRALRRLAEKVVLIFDADEAGQKAADRALELFLGGSLDVAVAVLPGGQDPAELLAQPDGPAQWAQAVEQAADALAYQFQRVRQRFEAATTLTAREQVTMEYLQKLTQLGLHRTGPLRRAFVLERLAELLPHTPRQIESLLDRLEAGARRPASAPRSSAPSAPDIASPLTPPRMKALAAAQRHLIGCLLQAPELFHLTLTDGLTLDEALTPAEFLAPEARQVYEVMYEHLLEDQPLTLSDLLGELAASGRTALGALATQAETEVERTSGGDRERLSAMARDAADLLVRHHLEQVWEAERQAWQGRETTAVPAQPSEPAMEIRILREAVERGGRPQVARILRPGTPGIPGTMGTLGTPVTPATPPGPPGNPGASGR